MPELLEVEAYRRAAEALVGSTITAVEAPDDWYLKGVDAATVSDALVGSRIEGVRRHGKLLLVDTDGPVLGLRFGMTGRLLVDGEAPIERLEYGSSRDEPAWDRFRLRVDDGRELVVRDPRRLGGVELDPDESRLGPDAATVDLRTFRRVLAGGHAPVKARLMDQSRLAGLGNLLVDEILWRAGVAPDRPVDSLDDDEIRRLHRALRRTLELLGRRGGSHRGDLGPERHPGGTCPRDGTPLERSSAGGRTGWWCPTHQR